MDFESLSPPETYRILCLSCITGSATRANHTGWRLPHGGLELRLAKTQKPGIMVADRIGEQGGWQAKAPFAHSRIQRAVAAWSSQRTTTAGTITLAGHPEGVEPYAPPWVAPSVVQSGPRFSYAFQTLAGQGLDVGKAYLHSVEVTDEHRVSQPGPTQICVNL
jgi:hypothetical protein